MDHELKCWPAFFADIFHGGKRFELRKNDRNFAVRDRLWLREWDRVNGYTGREMRVQIIYLLSSEQTNFGLCPGYVILGIAPVHEPALTREETERRLAFLNSITVISDAETPKSSDCDLALLALQQPPLPEEVRGMVEALYASASHDAWQNYELAKQTLQWKAAAMLSALAQSDERKTALEEALTGLYDACVALNQANGRCMIDRHAMDAARRALLDHPKEPKT